MTSAAVRSEDDEPAPEGQVLWVQLQFVYEAPNGDTSHFTIEGHPGPDFDPKTFNVHTEMSGQGAMTHIHHADLGINMRLDDVTVTGTNDTAEFLKRRARLRILRD